VRLRKTKYSKKSFDKLTYCKQILFTGSSITLTNLNSLLW